MRTRVTWGALVLACILWFLPPAAPARADGPALNFTNILDIWSNNDWCLGWEFNVLSPVTVTGLGVFDGRGLSANGHPVGLWDPLGNLLASTTVYPSDPLTGSFFRFRDLTTPVTLTPGSGYVVAAVYPFGYEYGYQFQSEGPPWGWTVDPSIEFVRGRFVLGTTLQHPSGSDEDVYGYFGGNFRLGGPEPIPEPAFLQLPFLVGLGGLGAWLRRRKAA